MSFYQAETGIQFGNGKAGSETVLFAAEGICINAR